MPIALSRRVFVFIGQKTGNEPAMETKIEVVDTYRAGMKQVLGDCLGSLL